MQTEFYRLAQESASSRSRPLAKGTPRTQYNYPMRYLIDGHNLIPALGLRLDALDDEMELIARLQEFCRLRRAHAEVYFDGAPAGQAGTRPMGLVTARFVRQGLSADAAIEHRLAQLGARAREWTVVSSDRRVRQAARAAHAATLTAAEFARQMFPSPRLPLASAAKTESPLSPQEVEEWLRIFRHPQNQENSRRTSS